MSHDDDREKSRRHAGNVRLDRGKSSSPKTNTSWLEQLHTFCEEHRALLEEPAQEPFADHVADSEENCLAFELVIRSPHKQFFAQIHDHLSRLATKLNASSSRATFSVSVIRHQHESRILAVFQMKEPDHILPLRLDDMFRRHLLKFHFRPTATAPASSKSTQLTRTGEKQLSQVAFLRTEYRNGQMVNDGNNAVETSTVTYDYLTEGSAALKPKPKALPDKSNEDVEDSPQPADTKDQVSDKNLTDPVPYGKNLLVFPLRPVSKEKGPLPALTAQEAEVVSRQGEVQAILALIEAVRPTLAKLDATPNHQDDAKTLRQHMETVDSIVAQKQFELQQFIDEIPGQPRNIGVLRQRLKNPQSMDCIALFRWPEARLRLMQGGVDGKTREENAEQYILRVYNSDLYGSLHLADLQYINPYLYRSLKTSRSRSGWSKPLERLLSARSYHKSSTAKAHPHG